MDTKTEFTVNMLENDIERLKTLMESHLQDAVLYSGRGFYGVVAQYGEKIAKAGVLIDEKMATIKMLGGGKE